MRGQPLLVLVAVLAGWSALRASTWTPPVAEDAPTAAHARAAGLQARSLQVPVTASMAAEPVQEERVVPARATFADPAGWRPAPVPQVLAQPLPPSDVAAEPTSRVVQDRTPKPGTAAAPQAVPPRRAAGHALLQAAGYARLQVPPQLAAYFARASLPEASAPRSQSRAPVQALAQVPAPAPAPAPASAPARTSRWSADGWLLWRDDTTTPVTSGRPSYGRSQLGAVVRYELAPQAGHRPQAYLRGSSALQGAREYGVAAGLSARPLAWVPLRLAGEVRLNQRASGTQTVPAAYAVSELPPQRLPGGLTGEAYVQAGYVGGSDSTAFVDGQARVDRSLAANNDFDLRAGTAVWGGAQDDGSRLDVGPSASLSFRMGEARGRVAADYRIRVAGNAEPASGPALTLSAGF